jgi:hypothetical protein
MSGGRPKGAISAFKNPANIAALHMQALEMDWLLQNAPPWEPGREYALWQRYLPAKVKRQLAEQAIERMEMLHGEGYAEWMRAAGYTLEVGPKVLKRPTVEQVLRAHRRMGSAKLVRFYRQRKTNGG